MKRYGKLILASIAVLAAILIPLALISGAVMATKGYSEYQITSTPDATLTVSSQTANTATVEFSINRSSLVINKYVTNDKTGMDKYEYLDHYKIYLIDIQGFNDAVEEYKRKYKIENDGREVSDSIAKSAVDMGPYIFEDRILEVLNENVYINKDLSPMFPKIVDIDEEDEETTPVEPVVIDADATVEITRSTVYLLTADTYAKEDKKYYKKKGNDYLDAGLKVSASIEKGAYYEEAINTHFEFTFGGLEKNHYYAVAITFAYSPDGTSSQEYNKQLSQYETIHTSK